MKDELRTKAQLIKELREARAREAALQIHFQKHPVPAYTWRCVGGDFELLDFNEAALAATEGHVEKYLGSRANIMYADMPDVLKDMKACLREQRSIERDVYYRFRSKPVSKHLRVTYVPTSPNSITVHVRDLTDIREALAERDRYRDRLAAVLAHAPLVLWSLDPDGTITTSQGRGLSKLGLRPRELEGESLFVRFAGVPDVLAAARAALSGTVATADVRFGDTVWDVRYAPVLDEDGRTREVVGVALDVTERRKAENERHERTARDLAESRRVAQTIQASRLKLRRLAARLNAIREEERTRLAREIHDQLGQALSALKIDAAALAGRLPDHDPLARERLRSMDGLIDSTLSTVRRIAASLRPPLLDEVGLTAAVEWHLREFGERTALFCRFSQTPAFPSLDSRMSTCIFRILQEALTNVARHAQAKSVDVVLSHSRDSVQLDVADDGVGIKPEHIEGYASLGIVGMRERAGEFDGRITFTAREGGGTIMTVSLPTRQSVSG